MPASTFARPFTRRLRQPRTHIALLLLLASSFCLSPSAAQPSHPDAPTPAPSQPAPQGQPCCGPVTRAGQALVAQLDATGVDHLWLAGQHVNWQTGEPDSGSEDRGHGRASHCSAFVGAFAQQQGVYVLRPPQHSQILLATAQVAWLSSPAAQQAGWQPLQDMRQAQTLANQGRLVLAAFPSPQPRKPGHIAIVRPAELSESELQANGPQITQAGQQNYLSTTTRQGFRLHHGAWPEGIRYFGVEESRRGQPAPPGHNS